jgi:hypothetical protein
LICALLYEDYSTRKSENHYIPMGLWFAACLACFRCKRVHWPRLRYSLINTGQG